MKRTIMMWATCLLIAFGCDSNDDNNTPQPPAGTVFFLVSEFEENTGGSYILSLTDPDNIAAARAIIADRTNENMDRLIVARVIRNNGSEVFLNKDLLLNKTWSWKIDEFLGFAGFTVEVLDGGPEDVEEDIDFWFQNTSSSTESGLIGFWGYTVLREVEPEELLD